MEVGFAGAEEVDWGGVVACGRPIVSFVFTCLCRDAEIEVKSEGYLAKSIEDHLTSDFRLAVTQIHRQ